MERARRRLARRRQVREASRAADALARRRETDAHRRAALEALREAGAGAIVRGAAELVVDADDPFGPAFRLVPRNPAAAPVDVHADWAVTSLHVGHHGSLHELDDPEVEDRRRWLHACVVAVVQGRSSETRGSQPTMTFETPDGPVAVLQRGRRSSPPGTTTYEPYEPADDTSREGGTPTWSPRTS